MLILSDTKTYTFRKIKGRDIFKLAKFFNKIDRDSLVSIFTENKDLSAIFRDSDMDKGEKLSKIGGVAVELVGVILKNIETLENDVLELLSEFSDLTAEEVGDLELEVFENMIIDFFKNPQISDFTKRMLQRLGLKKDKVTQAVVED